MPRDRPRRDLVDGIVDDWRREMADLVRPEYALAQRATRLGALLGEELTAKLVPWNLARTDYGVLNTLRSVGAPYELRPGELKRRLLLTSGGVSNVLNRLEKAGLVERAQDPRDGRGSWVRLTAAGVELAGETMRMWAEAEADFFRAVPDAALKAASDALRTVLVALGDLEPGAPPRRAAPATGRAAAKTRKSR